MTRTFDITPHPALNIAFQIVEALKAEGFEFTDEAGGSLEGLALVSAAGVLMAHEAQGRVVFGYGLHNLCCSLADEAE